MSVWKACELEMAINSLSSNLIKRHFGTQFKKKIDLCKPMRDIGEIDLPWKIVESVTASAHGHYPPGCYLSAVQLHRSASALLMDWLYAMTR